MGKPTSRRHSTKSTNSSVDENMRPKKYKDFKRITARSRQDSINNRISGLFEKLRDSQTSINNSTTNTPTLPNHHSNSLLNINKAVKRKLSNCDTVIEIKDDDLVTNNEPCTSVGTPKKRKHSPPLHCSTPFEIKNPQNNNKSSATNLNNEVINLSDTENDTFQSIDLTTASEFEKTLQNNTIIDLANTSDKADCTLVSISKTSLSLSGESDVTVLNKSQFKKRKTDRVMQKFANGIANLNSNEKAKLLDLITQNVFSGCKVTTNIKESLMNIRTSKNQGTETAEDTYIKEVILGQQASRRNSIGSNIYNPENDPKNRCGLRMVVIDGSNVAMEHGRHKFFSVKGLKICIDYFLKRGHNVKAFVPRFRCKFGKSSEPRFLDELERRGFVVYTPSREIQGRMVASYDDRYIVQCAAEFDGVIVSGDNYRDLLQENPRWKFVIENRLLPFTWVNDMIMFPRDPLGRNGPTLEQFLRHPNSASAKLIL